jgi:hypothetical protein
MDQFDKIEAIFCPPRLDDLVVGAREVVGKSGVWQAMWIIEKGQHKGLWAMAPVTGDWPFAWAPESDLAIKSKS